ncbi:MAG: cation diffusion facilitator family transporter [Chloroherpetonaceae bacterium]|nr:cation diffusion facilitator family transporter [Chloroherpetonaceae bacterium]MDW8437537.1 cation diffusion facilitator family transporter [Chloroherpetonaceae bacterium]
MEHNQHVYQEKLQSSAKATKGLFFSTVVTTAIFLIELVGGFLSGSLALLADAGHMATDVFALLISYVAVWFASKPATKNRTYGYYRVEILAALLNGVILCLISIFVCYEAATRFGSPKEIDAEGMALFGGAGLLANVASAFLLHRSKEHSVNVRAAYLHVLSDLLGSIGVLVAAGLIALTGWQIIDPIVSVLIAFLIIRSGWNVVSESVDVLLESVPRDLDIAHIERELRAHEHVVDLHDLHIWSITSGVNALSCHIVVDEYDCSQTLILGINKMLKERFNIDHVTIQLEDGHVRKHIGHGKTQTSEEPRLPHRHAHSHQR